MVSTMVDINDLVGMAVVEYVMEALYVAVAEQSIYRWWDSQTRLFHLHDLGPSYRFN